MKTALLLIDIQDDYFPGGRMEVDGSVEAAACARLVLEKFRSEQMPVIHIQHVSSRPNATFFIQGTSGVDFHESVKPINGEAVFVKHYPNSFRSTGLFDMLERNGIKNLIIAGMMTHMCIDATVRAAFDLHFECTVISDACATRALSFAGIEVEAKKVQASFLSALGYVYAKVMDADEFISGVDLG